MTSCRNTSSQTCILHDERGSSAVEFALLSPLYLLLLLGILAYGIYFGASHSLQQIAADAARVAVAGVSTAERETLARDYVARNAGGYTLVDGDRLQVAVGDSIDDTAQFEVSLTYDARGLPIWNLFEGLPMPGMTILKKSTIRIGGS